MTKRLAYFFLRPSKLPQLSERTELTDDIFFDQLPSVLDRPDDNLDLQIIDPRFSDFRKSALSGTTLNIEFEGPNELNFDGPKSSEAEAKRRIENYLLASLIVDPHFPMPYAGLIAVLDQNRICHSFRCIDFPYISSDATLAWNAEVAGQVNLLYPRVQEVFATRRSGRLFTALKYYHQAIRCDIDQSIRFLGMMMAMEAVFSSGAKSEITHQVSERSAFFLAGTPDQRVETYDAMKSLYDLRSKIAHGTSVNPEKDDLKGSFKKLRGFLADTLRRILQAPSTFTLFNSDSSKDFSTAMKSLVFRGEV
ncbi:hypothetical protein [Planctellipticum variicoloris]|uniref:hypothetical protein n=1 Tax=Planctellipticum variicoloris TaxID=3064265 RepID=UPI00301373DE|nr:HEPN domain-containing protein [Planctomycetaceae bacterium SH412]